MTGQQQNDNVNLDVNREMNYYFMELQDQIDRLQPNLMSEQGAVFHIVMGKVNADVQIL